MAVASLLSVAPQSQAASVTVTTSERSAPRYAERYHRPRMHHDCRVKKVKTYRHGRVIVKETRICR
jgi:hypothetical protein